MGSPKIIRKVIDGATYKYDKDLDLIFTDTVRRQLNLDRTQVSARVDMCIEITTQCNMTCRNCFSDSDKGRPGHHLPVDKAFESILEYHPRVIRFNLTGGEPLLHPCIEEFLSLPSKIPNCGFVLGTNGAVREDLDELLSEHDWLVAVSLHGKRCVHNAYTATSSFEAVKNRIKLLARRARLHIYTMLHNRLSVQDVEWLLRFRDEAGAKFLRFVVPRRFGRFERLQNEGILGEVRERLDARSGIKSESSLTMFMTVDGRVRATN